MSSNIVSGTLEPETLASETKVKSLKRSNVDIVDTQPKNDLHDDDDDNTLPQRSKVAKTKENTSSNKTQKPAKPSASQVLYETIKNRLHVIGGDGVELRFSNYAGNESPGNLGLFALKDFAVGEPISAFCGEIVAQNVAKEENRSRIRMRRLYTMRYEIDGKCMPSGVAISDPMIQLNGYGAAAFACDGRCAEKNNAKFREIESPYNVKRLNEFVQGADWNLNPSDRIIYIVASKPIAKGEEIFADWGVSYWARQQDANSSE